mmetsp:Transcript_103508/g.179763  ORF Transcript_103508/g.179763 Transcript_103508/m.179763 type:complete len:230 (-) Transcript_103508:198-887(-)
MTAASKSLSQTFVVQILPRLLSTMQTLTLVLACLHGVGHGRRVSTNSQPVAEPDSAKSLANLFLSFNPAQLGQGRGFAQSSRKSVPARNSGPSMSHLSTIQSKMVDKDSLASALWDLDVQNVEVAKAGEELDVRGYEGQKEKADIVIKQANGYDIGFKKVGGSYQMISDYEFWQQPVDAESLLANINQRYAVNAILKTQNHGFDVKNMVFDSKDNSMQIKIDKAASKSR